MPTCASVPLTSGPSASRCCGPSTAPVPAELSGPGILVTGDLSPADTAGLDLELVTGVVLAGGSPTSHAAILARARDIPLVVAAGPDVLEIPDGTRLAIDGGTGEVVVTPDEATVGEFARRATVLADERARDLAVAGDPAVTRDGTAVTVAANVGSIADARAAAAAGADGSGLVRTEFLFLGRVGAAESRRAADRVLRHRGRPGRAPDHGAHARRRRGQAAPLPADRG